MNPKRLTTSAQCEMYLTRIDRNLLHAASKGSLAQKRANQRLVALDIFTRVSGACENYCVMVKWPPSEYPKPETTCSYSYRSSFFAPCLRATISSPDIYKVFFILASLTFLSISCSFENISWIFFQEMREFV